MSELWGRTAKLQFGELGQEGIIVDASIGDPTEPRKIIPEIKFNITKTIKNKNTAEITIYNLGKDSRSVISQAKPGSLFCVLEVGYQNNNFTIFKGYVQTGGSRWNGYEWATTFKAVDGLKSKKGKVNRSFPKPVHFDEMFKYTMEQMKTTFAGKLKDFKDKIFENGFTLSGAGDAAMDLLVGLDPKQNLEWTIQEEVIHVKPVISAIDDASAAVISFDTGMIGAPKLIEGGIEFKSLLRDGLGPGRKAIIKSIDGEYDGSYLIQKSKFTGSLRGTTFEAVCRAKKVSDFEIIEPNFNQLTQAEFDELNKLNPT